MAGTFIFITLLPLASGWLLTGLMRRWACKGRLMDVPNPRSAHESPTPRGGGVGIVAGFMLASVALWAMGWVPGKDLLALLGGGLIVAGIGLMDDLGHVAIRWRLLAQIGAVTLGLGLLPPLSGMPSIPVWLILAAVAIGWLWLINLYNFMDGIDGLAAVEAITVALGASALLIAGGGYGVSLWIWSLAAACGGFLIWNRPPARIFMGDTGSGFLGFAFGGLALTSSQIGQINLWSWIILLAVFLTDASVTLLRRMLRGECWWQPHNCHAYQHLARRHGHLAVTIGVGVINLIWLLPWAWLAANQPAFGGLWVALAYVPLVFSALYLRAGVPE